MSSPRESSKIAEEKLHLRAMNAHDQPCRVALLMGVSTIPSIGLLGGRASTHDIGKVVVSTNACIQLAKQI
jgi:hypothetical protein